MVTRKSGKLAWGFAALPPWAALALAMYLAAPSVHAMQSSEAVTRLDNLIEQPRYCLRRLHGVSRRRGQMHRQRQLRQRHETPRQFSALSRHHV
ncbi:MAG: hypothetical protein AAF471_04810, partial [Myxococcota bacterium]